MGFLTKPKDVEVIIDALKTLIENIDLRISMGQNITNRIASDFTLQEMLEKTTQIYVLQYS